MPFDKTNALSSRENENSTESAAVNSVGQEESVSSIENSDESDVFESVVQISVPSSEKSTEQDATLSSSDSLVVSNDTGIVESTLVVTADGNWIFKF